MRGLSNKKHRAIVTALRQLATLAQEGTPAQEFGEHVQCLCDTYQRYENLLNELAACINEYEKLHHHLKIHVLAPALRQAKKQAEISRPGIEPYRAALEYVEVVRAI